MAEKKSTTKKTTAKKATTTAKVNKEKAEATQEVIPTKRMMITLTEDQAAALKILAEAHGLPVGKFIGNDVLISYLFYNRNELKLLANKAPELATRVVITED